MLRSTFVMMFASAALLFAGVAGAQTSTPPAPAVAAPTATPIQPGQTYSNGVRLQAKEAGVSFTLPRGYHGALAPGVNAFVVGAATSTGRIIMTADAFSIEEARSTMAQAIDLGDGVQLLPKSAPAVAGRRLTGTYAISGVPTLSGRVVTIVGPHGVGVALVAIAPAAELPEMTRAVTALEKSLTFSAPPRTPANPATPAKSGEAELSAVRLTRFYHGSGYSEKEVIHLCSNGTFRRGFNATSVSGLGSGVANSGNGGKYTLRGDQLQLEYGDGSRASYRVTRDGTKLLLNGKRWYREYEDCR